MLSTPHGNHKSWQSTRTDSCSQSKKAVPEIEIRSGDQTLVLPVQVRGLTDPPSISFEHEIIPILTKARCNSGSCHGKAEGKNGFKLSVFGFDPAADYEAIRREGRTRRGVSAFRRTKPVCQKGDSAGSTRRRSSDGARQRAATTAATLDC